MFVMSLCCDDNIFKKIRKKPAYTFNLKNENKQNHMEFVVIFNKKIECW